MRTEYTVEPSISLFAHAVKIDGRIIAYINWHGGINDSTREEIVAMFRAAPDLLAALRDVISEADRSSRCYGIDPSCEAILSAEAAIALAKP